MFTANRINQTNLALVQAKGVFKILNKIKTIVASTTTTTPTSDNISELNKLWKELASVSAVLATTLTAKREYCINLKTGSYEIDPRLLLFEFCHSLLLRKSQVQLIRKLLEDINSGRSVCHQVYI